MSGFKTAVDSIQGLKNVFATVQSLPKVACKRCGAIYPSKKESFICSDCIEKLELQREKERYEAQRRKGLLERSNIPKRQRKAIFSPRTDAQREVAKYFNQNFATSPLEESTDVLLFGTIGTGKTYLSCAFAIELIKRRGIEVKYVTEYDLLDAFFKKEYQRFDNFKQAQLLIVDELGKRELAEWQKIQLEELFSYRFNEMLPTIYITNLTEDRFKDFIGERLADRLRESNVARFAMVGDSLRGGNRK